MSGRKLDAEWQGWLKENIDRNCDPNELLGILLENQFTLASISEHMGPHFPRSSPQMHALVIMPGAVDHEALCKIAITRPSAGANVKRFPSKKLQLYTIDHFLSDAECDAVTALMSSSLRASTITIEARDDKYFRTSSTSDLCLIDDPLVAALDEKIARRIGIQMSYAEGIQGQHYAVGQQFKAHTDFFEPGTDEYVNFGGNLGNRTWTFMVYLNDVPKGGGTHFVNLNHVFPPRKGQAVVWNNLLPDGTPNYDTVHAGLPVEEGHKVIITKWFRQCGQGPMFYER